MLALQLFSNVYYIATTAAMIIGGGGGGSMTSEPDLTKEVALTAFCLAGLPIIIMAFWGVFQRIETLIRIYYWYQLISIAINLYFVFEELIFSGPCESVKTNVQGSGQAAACGMARGMNTIIVAFTVGIESYFVFIVWSYCEDLSEGGSADIGDLAKDSLGRPISKAAMQKRRMAEDPYTSMQGLYGNDGGNGGLFGLPGEYGTVYSAAAADGVGGGKHIFGNFHEMKYPPPGH